MKHDEASSADGLFQMPLPPVGAAPTDVWLRLLPAPEFEALLQLGLASMQGEEGVEMANLHAWFVRKYPTPQGRLNYMRRKMHAIQRA